LNIKEGLLEFNARVTKIEQGSLPQIYVVTFIGDENTQLIGDIHEYIQIFSNNQKVKIVISREKPNYRENKDFCGSGYLFQKRKENDLNVIFISIGGLLFKLITLMELNKAFNIMDKVYLCISGEDK